MAKVLSNVHQLVMSCIFMQNLRPSLKVHGPLVESSRKCYHHKDGHMYGIISAPSAAKHWSKSFSGLPRNFRDKVPWLFQDFSLHYITFIAYSKCQASIIPWLFGIISKFHDFSITLPDFRPLKINCMFYLKIFWKSYARMRKNNTNCTKIHKLCSVFSGIIIHKSLYTK